MTLLDGAATLNIAVFHTEYEDLQVSIFDSVASFNVQNAAGATSEGVEVEGRLMLSESLMVSGNMAFLDFEYDDFNRLKHIKDKDENILSKNAYNYRQ